MKKITKWLFKTIMVLVLASALCIPPHVTAMATSPTPPPTQAQLDDLANGLADLNRNMYEIFQILQDQIQDVRDSQSNTPLPTATPVPVYAPRVKLVSPQSVTLKSGETTEIALTLRNIGTSTAVNTLVQLSVEGGPFTADFVDDSNNVGNINEGSTKTVKLRITADADARGGTYALSLRYMYKARDGSNASESDSLDIRVESAAASMPRVTLSNFKASRQIFMPGDVFTITAGIENVGTGDATAVQTTLDGLDADKVYLTSDLNAAYFGTLQAGHKENLTFGFTVSSQARAGTYPLTFKLTYKDAAGNVLENTYTYYINVQTAAVSGHRATLAMAGLTAPGGAAAPGDEGRFALQIVNTGDASAANIVVTAVSSDENSVVPVTANKQTVAGLAPGATETLTFSFMPTATAQTRSYTISFLVEYETGRETDSGAAETDSFYQYGAVNVANDGDAEPTPIPGDRFQKPKMIVSAYSCDPGIVRAGREFDLHLTFQNASALRGVNNLKITLTAMETTEKKGSVFTPVNGSNTFYIDDIDAKGTVDQILRMYTVPDAEPRTYNILVSFSYQDEDYNEYTESEQISINVKQVTRIETSEFYIPTDNPAYQQVYLYFSIINSGRVSLSNMRVRVDGNFDTSNADKYIGNVGRGNTAYYEGFFTPMETGLLEGAIVVYGEDDTGEIVEFSKPFTMNVYEMSYETGGEDWYDPGFEMPGIVEESEGGIMSKVWGFVKKPYFWGPAAGVLALASIIVGRHVSHKKKRIDFDE